MFFLTLAKNIMSFSLHAKKGVESVYFQPNDEDLRYSKL